MIRHHAQTTCPACSSVRILCVLGTDLDMCLDCHRCWERIDPGEHFMVDGELLSFKKPCSNCAFRGSSEERRDRTRWAELQQTLAMGGEFYCHKGVPMKASVEEIAAGAADARMAFDFPQNVKTVDIAGTAYPYPSYVREHMRLCRGYLSKFVAPLASMNQAVDLLGDPLALPDGRTGPPGRGRSGKGKQWGYIMPPGTGPAGETCGSCKHIARSKRYRKCGLAERRWTHGFKTDVLARAPACIRWEKPE